MRVVTTVSSARGLFEFDAFQVRFMAQAGELLRLVGQAAMNTAQGSVMDEYTIEATPGMAEQFWKSWCALSPDVEQRRADLEAIVWLTGEDAENVATDVVAELRVGEPGLEKALSHYLRLIPSLARQRCRRPSHPSGTTVPARLALDKVADVVGFLPAHLPWFSPGDRPAAIGDWELHDLLECTDYGEIWKAVPGHGKSGVACTLHFFIHTNANEYLIQHEMGLLDRVRVQVAHPAIIPLQSVNVQIVPPCVQYDFVEAASLMALVEEWREADKPIDPAVVADIIRQIASAVGSLHHLEPALVLRSLRPGSIFVQRQGQDRWQCSLARVGLGPWSGRSSVDDTLDLYASPEQIRNEPAHPRDDVYALGVIWYQTLNGDFEAVRPGGSHWRRKLTEMGMHKDAIELLESCFEDDPGFRPADAAILADRLGDIPATEPKAPDAKPVAESGTMGIPGLRTSKAARIEPGSIGPGAIEPGAAEPGAAEPATNETSSEPGEEGTATPRQARPPGGASRPRVRRRGGLDQLYNTLETVAPEKPKLITNSVGLKVVLIPMGTFAMGSSREEPGRRVNEGPKHEVTISTDYYLGVTPVTQRHFERVMGRNPAYFQASRSGNSDHPVESVTWLEAEEFCHRLSEMAEEKSAGRRYRLPTEAEWEYACRAGTDSMFHGGDSLPVEQANFDANFPFGSPRGYPLQKTSAVGIFPANNFGLHDMHGNVWEWCADWLGHDFYARAPRRDPAGPPAGSFRVLRGGSWRNHALTCRAAYRNGLAPNLRDKCTGFRVVLEA